MDSQDNAKPGQNKVPRENRRNTRLYLKSPLKVVMGSIGGEIRYEMQTRNISITGFFLEFDKPGRFPFTPASIMEVWMQLSTDETIFFNGKMARVIFPNEGPKKPAESMGPGIAVKIVQIDRENEEALKSFVFNLLDLQEGKQTEVA